MGEVGSGFFYHPRMLAYDFGPEHPLKPDRLRRAIQLAESQGFVCEDPGPGEAADVLRVHEPEYVEAVDLISRQIVPMDVEDTWAYGFNRGDNPSFVGMYEASLAYTAGSAAAARRVNEGAYRAFSISGGLHHARPATANGFCVFNDCAVAIHILRERFARVAYIDIDVHAGEGVQIIFADDPTVLTCSIHQDPRTLFPGMGFIHEPGINVPLAPGTSGDVWLWAFREGILPFVNAFQPEAIVLQMGTDSHRTDPLARIENDVQHWLGAVEEVHKLGLPTVALGGGGYDVRNVPRMWVAACLLLSGREIPEKIPSPMAEEWGTPTFLDPYEVATSRKAEAEAAIRELMEAKGSALP